MTIPEIAVLSDGTLVLSLPGLRGGLPFLVRLVHRYYGTVRLLLHVHVRRSVYGLRGPVLFFRTRRTGDPPVLVHVVSQRARVLRLRRTDNPLAKRGCRVAFLPTGTESASCSIGFSKLNSPAHRYLYLLSTLQETPRGAACKTRGQDGFAVLLSVGLFHPLQHAGLSRRTPVSRPTVRNRRNWRALAVRNDGRIHSPHSRLARPALAEYRNRGISRLAVQC
jgi:hypothetical protein